MRIVLLIMAIVLSGCIPVLSMPTVIATTTGKATETAQPTVTALPECTIVTGVPDGDLNLRVNPGTQFGVIRTLKEGTRLTVIKTENGWHYVKPIGNIAGWINSKYCRQETP